MSKVIKGELVSIPHLITKLNNLKDNEYLLVNFNDLVNLFISNVNTNDFDRELMIDTLKSEGCDLHIDEYGNNTVIDLHGEVAIRKNETIGYIFFDYACCYVHDYDSDLEKYLGEVFEYFDKINFLQYLIDLNKFSFKKD